MIYYFRDISVDDFLLLVESLDAEVVAFAPMLASHHPRVIAVGEGNGDLLRVTLLLSEECRLRRNVPLLKQVMSQIYRHLEPQCNLPPSLRDQRRDLDHSPLHWPPSRWTSIRSRHLSDRTQCRTMGFLAVIAVVVGTVIWQTF